MKTFESEISSDKIIKRGIYRGLFYAVIINLINVIYTDFGVSRNEIWEVTNIILLLLMFVAILNKRNRHILKLFFNDDTKTISVEYFQLFFRKKKIQISYSKLGFYYGIKVYGRGGSRIMTLGIYNEGQYIADIRKERNDAWDWETVQLILEKLRIVANELKSTSL
ncbi:MAG TPA: hypothetical protein VNG53_07070 [Bacteroidia bacterium]|nr:hypothetical protein [Bacteroidia bacterium]